MSAPRKAEFARFLRTETVGGAILLIAAAIALIYANSPWGASYLSLRDFTVGPQSLHLDLTLGEWAQDGLLAVFFFVAGLELKRELVIGELADRRRARLPVLAAVGGVVAPALIALAIGWGTPGIDQAWAIPIATDIAFALGVLALTGSRLPAGARVFLLSLAVVDDLIAILVIAAVFTSTISVLWLLGALACLVLYAYAQHRRITSPWLYVPLALVAWWAMHQAGVHATLAGVAMGLLTRVRPDPGEDEAPAARLEHRVQPWSAGVCVPLFAFFAAGVPLDSSALHAIVDDRIALGIIAGLLIGKTVGIFGTSWLAIRTGFAERPRKLGNRDMFALSVLGGIGFTVSLLVAELALENVGDGSEVDTAKAAVLLTSMVASLVGSALLIRRGRAHDRRAAAELDDLDDDTYATDDADGDKRTGG
ncbi:Na+/H+ antiporter NhaA [Rhodococcus sp. D2-41]|uniref:Na(+)/H(+) antiporter NhaA n=1 Tax=Speluncibacter jeojiensis TaxID=2710754 RepID=A0A9X4RFW0_9ACTN|nr:Na+/H+ antiporter NhaA [Rhodococcus sp. D2-41]MDG3009389.1 Na+/H+ antiporter NhaA [Rhodococcus sp. D2-41]MDG3016984.1 Na+/H+ antiporter NhaA [Corynebacteriales bacterium D3-21]